MLGCLDWLHSRIGRMFGCLDWLHSRIGRMLRLVARQAIKGLIRPTYYGNNWKGMHIAE